MPRWMLLPMLENLEGYLGVSAAIKLLFSKNPRGRSIPACLERSIRPRGLYYL